MSNFAKTKISLCFEKVSQNSERFIVEYDELHQKESIIKYIKKPQSISEATEGELIIIELLSVIYNKIEAIEDRLNNTQPKLLQLNQSDEITEISHEYFKISSSALDIGCEYYGRFTLPVYPKNTIGLFFTAQEDNVAKITQIHPDDASEYSSYLMSLVRAQIRRLKGI